MAIDKRDVGFVNSTRGHLIISQALSLAIESLNKSGEHESNRRDMEYLFHNVFSIYKSIEEEEKKYENLNESTKRLLRGKNQRKNK